jgi:hypothetical protein
MSRDDFPRPESVATRLALADFVDRLHDDLRTIRGVGGRFLLRRQCEMPEVRRILASAMLRLRLEGCE